MGRLRSRVRITGKIVLDSALHVGTGRPGRAASDHGVTLLPDGRPLIPGSSLKGVLRATAESLAEHLGMTACFLSGEGGCATGNGGAEEEFRNWMAETDRTGREIEAWVAKHLCDVCRLFGSPLVAGRVRAVDAPGEWDRVPEVRDGVCLDRDSRTAVKGRKFDFEVVPAGVAFDFRLDAMNLEPRETLLLWACLREWQRGFTVGGKVSRGLGAAHLENLEAREVNLEDPAARVSYLVRGEMGVVPLEKLDAELERMLSAGGSDA